MAKKLWFDHTLNVSVQPGDTIYYVTADPTNPNGFPQAGKNFHSFLQTKPIKYGIAIEVNHAQKWVNVNNILGVPDPTADQYIFFSKDRRANVSGLIGYFAETEFVNDSSLQTEIFATGLDYVESSK